MTAINQDVLDKYKGLSEMIELIFGDYPSVEWNIEYEVEEREATVNIVFWNEVQVEMFFRVGDKGKISLNLYEDVYHSATEEEVLKHMVFNLANQLGDC